MTGPRTTVAVGALALEAGTALLAVVLHHSLTAEYGDVTAGVLEAVVHGPATGVVVVALLLLGTLGLLAHAQSSRCWVRRTAALLPVATAVGVLLSTPLALAQKLDSQYDVTPRCLLDEGGAIGPSPGRRAARESQGAYDSVEHAVLFHGGGGSGVGGCDRGFVVPGELDVLAHYRAVLPAAGWRVVEDDGDRLRAERGHLALEVVVCETGGVAWAGERVLAPRVGCELEDGAAGGRSPGGS